MSWITNQPKHSKKLKNRKKMTTTFKRYKYKEILEWKQNTQGTRALLIEGARRVGKSTIAKNFAQNEYGSHLIIDFSIADNEIKSLFTDYRNDINKFFSYLEAYTGTHLQERNSVIVFDEVQRHPPAREFIKQLIVDGRYDYIETGSLISIKKNVENIVIPSEERVLDLDPLNFDEFLLALEQDSLSALIKESYNTKTPLPEPIHRKAQRLFREYMLVGGMPQAVEKYIETNNFGEVDTVKRDILNLYNFDIEKFGGIDAKRIKRIFQTLPGQLAKHEKKYTLSALDKNARSREYADAFFWLEDSCIVNNCLNATDPNVGLSASADDSKFKCYMADTGLLASHAFQDSANTPHEIYRDILQGKLELNEGMFTENVVAQQLKSAGHKLYFYSKRDDKNSKNTMEIDFLISKAYESSGKLRITPIEVKSSKRYRTSSLDKFKAKFKRRVGTRYVLHPRPMQIEEDIIKLPLYMAHCL